MPELSPQILSDLQAAERGRSLLEAAGLPIQLWEACCLAFSDRELLHREVERLTAPGARPHPELVERVREIRSRSEMLVSHLRDFINPSPRSPEEAELREMMLGFIAGSPAARTSAEQWICDPARARDQAAPKLQVIEILVERYRLALRSGLSAVDAPSGPPAAPTGLHAIAAEGKISLAWNPSEHATHYRIFRAPASSGPYAVAGEPSEPWWTDGPAPGATVVYSVVAVNRLGESAPSTPISVAAAAAPSLPPPTGLDVTLRTGEVELTWTPTPGAQAYTVVRAPAPDGPWQSIARALTPSYVDSGLTQGVAHYYSVVALGPNGPSSRADAVRAVPLPAPGRKKTRRAKPPVPPGPPGRLMAIPGDAQVLLRWSPGQNATAHAILRSMRGAPPVEIARSDATMFLDAGLRNGATYVYVIRALNAAGLGTDSAPIEAAPQGMPEVVSTPAPVEPPPPPPPRIAPPPAPEGLAVACGDGQVALTWVAAPRASLYRIERAASARGPFEECGTATAPAFTQTGLENGRTYAFRIVALNDGGVSAPSDAVVALPVAPPPPPPRIEPPSSPEAVFIACGNSQVTVSWDFTPRASLYRIERAETPAGPFAECASLSAPPWTEAGLENGRSYAFRVIALNESGASAPSDPVTATPIAPPPKIVPPAAPGNVAIACGNGQATLSWDAVPGATLYRVGRAPTPDGPFAECATLSAPPWTETGLENGRTYAFRIVALNESGESPPSAPAIAVPVAPPPKIEPPPAPAGLAAACGNAQVTLTWDPSSRAASYRIERAETPAGPFAECAALSAPPWTETGLENGRTYAFRIVALNESGESPPSVPAIAVPVAPPPKIVPPAAPGNVGAACGNAQVTLTWDPSPRAASYRIERAPSADGPFAECAALSAPPWTETGLENGRTYVFRIVALNESGESPPSAPAIAVPVAPPPKIEPPPAPAGLAAACGNAQVTLTWDPSPRAASYRIERAPSADGPFAECAASARPAFTDTGLENGRSYAYRVVARNEGGESAPSAAAAAAPLAPPPTPAGLKGRHGDGRVTIQWDPAPGATHYRLKRATERTGPWETIATTPRTTFADSGLANGTTYFYMVRAANAGGKSAYSARLRATPLAPPAAPADLVATAGDGEVTLSWTAVPGALKYLVKRATAPEGPFATVGRPAEPGYVDRAAKNGTTYTYGITAVGSTGEGPVASAQATPMPLPGAPEGVTTAPGDAKVSLTWSPVAEATSYRVERALAPEGPYEAVGTPATPSWVDAGLENGITHFYRIVPRNARGDGPFSIVVQAVPAPPPPAPAGLRATARSGRVELAWDGWPTADRFRVKRSERAGGPYAVVGNPTAPTYVDYGVRNGTAYYYLVTAIGQAGESAASSEVSATPAAAAPTGNENVPTLEQFDAPLVGGARIAPGVDLERLMDLRRVEQLRTVFDGTGQKFEAWEVAALIAREGHDVRRTLDTLLRLKNDGESDEFEAGALALFDRILTVRAQLGSLVRRLRAYLEMLSLPALSSEAVEIALSFVVSADKSRGRAEAWLEDPETHKPAAAAYFRKALEIARGYLEAMGRSAAARPLKGIP